MSDDDINWRSSSFRHNVVNKMYPLAIAMNYCTFVITLKLLCVCIFSDEAIAQSGMPTSKNSLEMENHVFLKAKSKVSTYLMHFLI